MKPIQALQKAVSVIPKVIEVLQLAHKLFSTMLDHFDPTPKIPVAPAQAAPSE